jgi:hypothetical protein
MKDQESCEVGMVTKGTVLQIKQGSSLELLCQEKACLRYP